MLWMDIIGWIGNVCFIVGCFLMAKKRPIPSMYWSFFGNITWGIIGIGLGISSMIFISFLLSILNCVGIYQWSRDNGSTK